MNVGGLSSPGSHGANQVAWLDQRRDQLISPNDSMQLIGTFLCFGASEAPISRATYDSHYML